MERRDIIVLAAIGAATVLGVGAMLAIPNGTQPAALALAPEPVLPPAPLPAYVPDAPVPPPPDPAYGTTFAHPAFDQEEIHRKLAAQQAQIDDLQLKADERAIEEEHRAPATPAWAR